ncbi:acyl-[ACP]--phospholipid O-acyltransferase [Candidatus Berkiella aquae]|uniref:Acyl-[ACP]--phospholipid O-acyltransferase n=1 Tax=Candidatus Berkiella aquae TaxID=295108 RepID=A0A0Q9YVR9_9GAMM|nr:acyl-[ACP]--phospholipid O-acyltransferase [Candidatus Berkiella aquae]MCS5710002.1 acyl-[ACP]--phospholipid O-acyltransferase [Candidatus Berkiella aquae]
MYKNQFSLLTKQRFLPLFLTQFLGAFNDNVFKSALVVLVTFVIVNELPVDPKILVTLASCLLIAPMFIFSALAGALADKYEKAKLIRIIKMAEIVLMLLGALGFIFHNVTVLMTVLFLLGVQSTFFGPLKYSILPAHLAEDELVGGTALIETGTFIAILLGNILGVMLIVMPLGSMIICATVLLTAILGYISSCYIPQALPPAPFLGVSFNVVKDTIDIVKFSTKSKDIYLSILGISWFWLIGFVFLAEFPNYAKDYIKGNEQVFVLFLTIFSVGVGIGSIFCNRLVKGRIEATFVPLSALGITLFTVDLYFSTLYVVNHLNTTVLQTPWEFLKSIPNWRILFDVLMIAICGGIYIVPLYAILQHRSAESHKARIIASNNIINAVFMSIAAVVVMIMLKQNYTIPQIFLTIAILNIIVVIQSCRLLPGALVKSIMRMLLQAIYRVEVNGLEHYDKAGERVVIVPNHTSFIDAVLLAAFLPGKLSFAMYSGYAKKWWVKPVTLFVEIFGIEPANPFSLKSIIKYVRQNKQMVIFPEGRITVTGALMKIYEGPGMIADKADAVLLPILIQGAQYTPFSRLKGRIHIRWFPKITLTIFPSEKILVEQECKGRKRRQVIGEQLYQIMAKMLFLGNNLDVTLFEGLLQAKDIHGSQHIIIEDINRQPLTYRRLTMGSLILGKKLAKLTTEQEVVGLLLPNLSATVVTFFGLLAYRRVVALLNFSTGTHNVVLACHTAQIKVVCTARAFIATARLQGMIDALSEKGIKIVYLEDLRKEISTFDKGYGLLACAMPKLFGFISSKNDPNQPAVILFTSGSEGTPKAVVLSSRNIQANKNQMASRVDFSPIDIVLNALPMFHSFGLTAGTILPILYGMKVFFYPSPLHYRVIPELSYDINATILFGTNTFLAGYARYANAYDFYSIRYVFSGAEKLREENRRLWADKYGVRIFEGYGATETSPVISVNTPMHNRPGTVGQMMPGMEYQLSVVPEITDGGRLSVKGPNIMLGYMFYDHPGVINPPLEGWYDTGDIVEFDKEGYITIKGRAKRFAKIGGEMVSLTFVELMLDKLWPEHAHAVATIPDEKKGEQLVLVTTRMNADKADIVRYARANGISELAVPKAIHWVDKLPLLGSGKVDYVAIAQLLKNQFMM